MHEDVARIRQKVNSGGYPLLLKSLRLDGLRGFKETRVEFNFPVVALVGENGAGKTTVLKGCACAYDQKREGVPNFFPGKFFLNTPWDRVANVRLDYAVKHGDVDLAYDIRKPSARWRISKRPKRDVYLYDISRTMPLDALVGYGQVAKQSLREFLSQALSDDSRADLSYIMGRRYEEASFAYQTGAPTKRVGLLKQPFGQYSKYHQGAGEATGLDLLGVLQEVPANSLLLIDEIEASLHPKAQRRLMHSLLRLSRTRQVQVIISTHSQHVLEELPPEGRVLLIRAPETRVLYGASAELCLSSIDEHSHPELTVYVEDARAGALVRELVVAWERETSGELLSRIEVVTAGSVQVVETLAQLAEAGLLRNRSIAVKDGGEREGKAVSLPGQLSPERQVFQDLEQKRWPGVPERLGVSPGDGIAVLEEARLDPDHHKWPSRVGDRLRMSRESVWDALAAEWVKHCLGANERDGFIVKLTDRLSQK